MLDHCDAIVFGGGGLFETSHHPQQPYFWLRYLSRNNPTKPVLAAGVGVGPLSLAWQKRLRDLGSPFTECYLRDADSVKYAHDILGWPAKQCRDFVDEEFLRQFGVGKSTNSSRQRQLGVAVRAWPGLEADALAHHVMQVAKETDSDSIRFFVLEAPGGIGPDLPFTNDVSSRVTGMPTSVRAYVGSELVDFMTDMVQCHSAVSMKLHSSAVWGAAGVPMYPIFYAPKTAILFGQPYRGLEVKNEVMFPAAEEPGIPRAQEVVGTWLSRLNGGLGSSRAVLSRLETLDLQTRSFVWNVAAKAGLTPHARSI